MTTTEVDGTVWVVHDEKRMHLPELTPHCVLCLQAEVEALRTIVRKVAGGSRWWAALSFVEGVRGRKSSWTEEEQEVLRRAGLTR